MHTQILALGLTRDPLLERHLSDGHTDCRFRMSCSIEKAGRDDLPNPGHPLPLGELPDTVMYTVSGHYNEPLQDIILHT